MKSCIVKRKATPSSFLPVVAILAITLVAAVLLAAVYMFLAVFILALGTGIAVYLLPTLSRTEYEYNLEGETLSVALIRNNSSRKEIFSCDIAHLISCEPYKNQPISGTKVDVQAGENKSFIAVFSEEGTLASVIFSPDDAFIGNMRLLAPSKVKLNIMY